MADIANSISASSPVNANSALSILEGAPQDIGIISPRVIEAMDRIFPQSASQLFNTQFSNDSNLNTGKINSSSKQRDDLLSVVNVLGDNSGQNSASIQTTPKTIDGKLENSEAKGISDKKHISKLNISRSDLESITSSISSEGDEHLGKQPVRNGLLPADIFSSDCHTREGSDSEDMCRPFVSKERKERKKHKKKKKELGEVGCLRLVFTNAKPSDDEFQISSKKKTRNEINMNESNLSKRSSVSVMEEGYLSGKAFQDSSRKSSESFQGEIYPNKTSSAVEETPSSEISQQSCQNNSCGNLSVSELSETSCKDMSMVSEDASNMSFSSSKENLHGYVVLGQKLPKLRHACYDIKSDKKLIRNTFPRCYVVLGNVNSDLVDLSKTGSNFILPLPNRLKYLKELCDKGSIKCRRKKKGRKYKMTVEEVKYKNIFQETLLVANSEEEFKKTAGKSRSLRKRNQNISYAEPSEFADDILSDMKIKRSRSRKKEGGAQDEDTSGESKKKKNREATAVNGTNDNTTAVGKQGENITAAVVVGDNDTKIIAYPKEITDRIKAGNVNSKLDIEKGKNKSHATAVPTTVPSSISIISAGTTGIPVMLNTLPCLRPLSPLVTPMPIGISALNTMSRMSDSFVRGPALHPALRGKTQFCMMKMDGKDVLVQLVPSAGSAFTPSSTPNVQTVIVPGSQGSRVMAPSGLSLLPPGLSLPPRMISQTMLRNSTSTSSTILTTSGTVPGTAAALSATSLFRLTNAGGLSNLPIIPVSQLSSLTRAPGVRPTIAPAPASVFRDTLALPRTDTASVLVSASPSSSSAVSSQNTVASTVYASSLTGVVASIRPSSTAVSSTTVATTSMRNVRVFVPGCSATGTRGHFTTLTSLQANNNPLTRVTASSQLLPQRKRPQDHSMTLEQRVAKRRRLEKKYPLPPGVVIKTEPLDTPPSTPNTTAVRSLLRQGCIQVIPSSRGAGAGQVQSIRIIAPSLASALNTRPVTNMVYRTAGMRGGQTVLVPMSMASLTSSSAVTPTSVSRPRNTVVTSGNLVLVSPPPSVSLIAISRTTSGMTHTTTTTPSSSATTRLSTTISASSSTQSQANTTPPCVLVPQSSEEQGENNPVELSSPYLTLSTSTPATSTPSIVSQRVTRNSASLLCTSEATYSSHTDTSLESAPHVNGTDSSTALPSYVELSSHMDQTESSLLVSTCNCEVTSEALSVATAGNSSVTTTVAPSIIAITATGAKPPCGTKRPRQSASHSTAVSLETLQTSITGLQGLIAAQESRGLKGERLDKLKSLLREKEATLSTIHTVGDEGGGPPESFSDRNGTEIDPFVID